MIRLVWPDGSIVSGETYREVEDALRASQWHTYRTRRAFRAEMRRRARLWDGRPVPTPLAPQSSRAFIQTLVDAGMCLLDPDHR